jgi:hypothetical protein
MMWMRPGASPASHSSRAVDILDVQDASVGTKVVPRTVFRASGGGRAGRGRDKSKDELRFTAILHLSVMAWADAFRSG